MQAFSTWFYFLKRLNFLKFLDKLEQAKRNLKIKFKCTTTGIRIVSLWLAGTVEPIFNWGGGGGGGALHTSAGVASL